MSVLIRETQPLAVTYEIETPSGKRYRWAPDEWSPEDVPLDATFTDTMPGGFDSLDVTLRRHAEVDYEDLERLSTIRVRDSSHAIVGEYRLERAPRSSGDDLAIRPSAVGWQAHLEDDKSVREIYVDSDLTTWQGPSLARQVANRTANYSSDGTIEATYNPTGLLTVATKFAGPASSPDLHAAEAWYDAHGIPLGELEYIWSKHANINSVDTNWQWRTVLATDDVASGYDASSDLRAPGPGFGALQATTSTRKWAFLQLIYTTALGGSDSAEYAIWWTPAVFGTHGLPIRGLTSPSTKNGGLYASDIVTHAVETWAPRLRVTTESVPQSSLILPHAAYLEPTTVAEIVRDVSRYEILDWAIWDNLMFYMLPRGTSGRAWRARTGPTKLEETGPQVDRVWNGVVVEYRDAAGGTRTVGPIGSRSDTETADLADPDPDNPATLLGIRRWERLQTDSVGDPDTATALGRAFLQETKRLDRSGRATIVGYVEDDRGVTWPYHAIRSGDTISFVDAADPSPRRIVRTSKDTAASSCTIDLDAPPEGLQAVLARLGLFMSP